jgi:signal transduction histidine kinase
MGSTTATTSDDEAERREGQFQKLYALMIRLSETDTLEAALDEILGAALDLVHADAGYIRLFGPPDDPFPFVVQRGFNESYIRYFGSLPEPVDPRARGALWRGERVVIEDMFSFPPFEPHLAYIKAAGHTSLHAIPLMSRGAKPVGAICANFFRRHVPTEDEFQSLDLYARLAADTIERHERQEERARTEAELRKALAAKDEFLGLVSHELRTPMTVIRGLATILDRPAQLPEDTLKEVYSDLARESERLHRLIENMLTVARIQAGRAPTTQPIMLNLALQSCAARLRHEMPDLVLVIEDLPQGLVVEGVEHHIDQVIHNLVQNARKYSPPGSPVHLSACFEDDWVRVSVADRGIGLEDPAEAFSPFRRGAEAEKHAPGLGLGLAVCKTLVEALGGRIWAESRAGGGTVFNFTLRRFHTDGNE